MHNANKGAKLLLEKKFVCQASASIIPAIRLELRANKGRQASALTRGSQL